MSVWALGRSTEQDAIWAQAEALARSTGDPVVLSRALQPRVVFEALSGRLEAAETLAEEALRLAMTAGDDWEIAMSAFAKAVAASNIIELRERVERAQSLLAEVGNVYHLANLLASTAYGALGWGDDRDAKQLIERAVVIARELDDPSIWLTVRGNLGLVALLTGDTHAADKAFREELRLCRELVARPFASEGLRGLAAVAAADGDGERAARLVGASDAQRYGQEFPAVEARLDAAFFEAARTRLGSEPWLAAVRHGASLSFDQAIGHALEDSHC
jgi:tetratricopeptide (TPR) repeat protein